MKKLYPLLSILFLIFLCCEEEKGEEPIKFVKTFGGSNHDKGYFVQQVADGGYIITGRTSSFGNGSLDVWLIKTDSEGNEIWNNTFGGSDSDKGNHVEQTTDGGYLIVGYTDSFGNDSSGVWSTPRDFWLIKTDPDGNEEWNKTYGGIDNDYGRCVQQTKDGGYVIIGTTMIFGNGFHDGWLIKTDPEGNTVPYGE